MCRRHTSLASVLLLIVLLIFRFGAVQAVPLSGVAFSAKDDPSLAKFDSALARLALLARGIPSESVLDRNVEAILAGRVVPHPKGMIEVWITLSSDQDLPEGARSTLGIAKDDHYYHYDHFVQALVPIAKLEELGKVQDVTSIGLPPVGIPTVVISEGVGRTNASNYLNAGFQGQGIKIGVLDRAFGDATSLIGSELPLNTVLKSFYDSTSGNGNIIGDGSSHGTACAEIVHDMAPGASLYLVNFDTAGDFAAAVQYLLSQNVQIISHSVNWFNQSFYDGTGPIASIVAQAAAQGVLWVNAAGNNALRHWEGTFVDPNNNGWNDFSTGDETIPITVAQGDTIILYLTWDDWPNSTNDYDLYLFYEDPTSHALSQVASSTGWQTGFQNPTEYINYAAGSAGTYHIAIKRPFFANTSLKFELFSGSHDLNLYRVLSTSLGDPAPSANAVAVGAMAYNAYTIESFSSHGPTTRGATKPEITGPDAVTTASWSGPFYGTSAATPHVAGAAADVWSQTPTQSAAQVRSFLEGAAIDFGASGVDNTYGYGMLNLPPFLAVAWTSPPPTSVTAGTAFQVAWSVTGTPDHVNVHWNPTDPTSSGCCLGPVTTTNSSSSSPSASPLTLTAPTQNVDGTAITSATTVRYVVHAHSSSTGATAFSTVASVVVSPSGGPTCRSLTLLRNTSNGGGAPTASPPNSSGCGTGLYIAGATIQLTAYPASGWNVGSWTGTQNDTSTSTSNSLVMPASAWTITVNYVQGPQTGPPAVTTGSADGISSTGATLHGTVNPNGLDTKVYFGYTTDQVNYSYTPPQDMGVGTSTVQFLVNLSGLACQTSYWYYAIAYNSAGGVGSYLQPFNTASCPPPGVPSVLSESAGGMTMTSAVLHASVDPNGVPTTVFFQYGTNTNAVNGTPSTFLNGTGAQSVSTQINGLTCGTIYYYEAIAFNSNTYQGTSSPWQTFATNTCSGAGTSFYTLTPCRILDTRPPVNTPISASSGTAIQITGICGVPSTAKAIAINVTAVGATSQGILSVYPIGSVPPNYTVAVGTGQTRAASTVIGLSPYGTVMVAFFTTSGQGQTNFLIDVTGYFQ